MKNIVGEIHIIVGKRPTNIVPLVVSALNKFLKFGYYHIITAMSACRAPQFVVHFFSAVQTQYHIMHLTIGKCNHIIIHQQSIGCQRKTKILVVCFFHTSGVFDQLFDYFPIHQRFSAKKVYFQIASVSRMRNQKIQRLLSDFEGHQRLLPLIFPLTGKTIVTSQIASMRHMQTKCFDVLIFHLKICSNFRIKIIGE